MKYKMTGFAKFIIFSSIVAGVYYGMSNFTNVSELLPEKDRTHISRWEQKIKQKIDQKKKAYQSKRHEPQEDYNERMEQRLMQLVEENERLADELKACREVNLDVVSTKDQI